MREKGGRLEREEEGEKDASKSLYDSYVQLLYSYIQDGVCLCVSFSHLQEVTWARM